LKGKGHAEAFYRTDLASYRRLHDYLAAWPATSRSNLAGIDQARRRADAGEERTLAQ